MDLVTGQIAAVRFQKRLTRKGTTHGFFISIVGNHALSQDAGQEPGQARFCLGCLNSRPASDFLFQRDRNIPKLSHTRI